MATNVNIQLGYKDSQWFTDNPTLVLLDGQIVYLEQTGTYKIGDGVTALSSLNFLGGATDISGKQDTLVSGTNIKTVNGTTLLGSGDLVINSGGYSLFVAFSASNPADATTYHFGSFYGTSLTSAGSTSPGNRNVYVLKSGVIKNVSLTFLSSAGSNEDISLFLVKNADTANKVLITSSLKLNSLIIANTKVVATGLNMSVVSGDYIEVQVVCPTWVTNPTGIFCNGHIYIE